MDFFGLQDSARRESFFLVVAFVVAMLFNAVIIQYLIAGFSYFFFFESKSWATYSSYALTLILWGIVLIGCWRRWREIAGGGHQLAASFGALRVDRQTQDQADKTLLNVVEEMTIAAGIKRPTTYCLREETAINAFVAGTPKHTVLVVSQGALDKLDRNELMSVVGHEFGHINNNDLSINMRMLIVLGGLNAIDETGQALWDEATDPSDRNVDVIQAVAGLVLRILGSACVFSGNLIKSAFSRKREFFADAKSVEYTRNSWALASALDKISAESSAPALHSRFAGELAHMCFHAPWRHLLNSGWLATHPPPADRIKAVEPYFSVKVRQQKRETEAQSELGKQTRSKSISPIDTVKFSDLKSMRDLGAEISIVLSLMIESSGQNKNKLHADYAQILKSYTNETFPMRSKKEPGIDTELEQALNALVQVSAVQRQALLDHCDEIISLDGISMNEEKQFLLQIQAALNPARKAA